MTISTVPFVHVTVIPSNGDVGVDDVIVST